MEYLQRFVRLAARYEEEAYGSTKIGYRSIMFSEGSGSYSVLGSGMIFPDDSVALKEIALNANRIESWRKTKMYEYYAEVSSRRISHQPL
jgi:hypothetical protein